jgi:hypothetical protein
VCDLPKNQTKSLILLVLWRKGWDSNPRYPCRYAGFQDRCLKPLGHPSKALILLAFKRRDARQRLLGGARSAAELRRCACLSARGPSSTWQPRRLLALAGKSTHADAGLGARPVSVSLAYPRQAASRSNENSCDGSGLSSGAGLAFHKRYGTLSLPLCSSLLS